MILSLSFIFSSIPGYADDFIKMATKTAWKVKECALDGEAYKVKVCFSNQYCEKRYPQKDYSCEKGIACGENFVNSSSFSKGNVKWASSFKAFDSSYFVTVPFDSLKKWDTKGLATINPPKTPTEIPVVIYTAKQSEDDDIKRQMQKTGIPANAFLFSLKKSGGQYQLTSEANPVSFKSVFGEAAHDQSAEVMLTSVLREFVAQELSSCPD